MDATPFSEVIEDKKEHIHPLVQWWYRLIVPKFQLYGNETFLERERVRKARLLSVVLFFFLIVAITFLPACLFLPNPWIFWLDVVLCVAGVITIGITRIGFPTIAGAFLIVIYELVVAGIIYTTFPLDEPSLQYYDICIIGLLLCVVLLPAKTVFVTAMLNTLMVFCSLQWQPHNAVLAHDLVEQFWPIFLRPVGLQFMVAGVSFLFVTSLTQANLRASRAETIARLEHELAEQQKRTAEEKRQLEAGIQLLVRTNADMVNARRNGQLNAETTPLTADLIPYPDDARILYPLVGVINALWMRLRHTDEVERELSRTQQAIVRYANLIETEKQIRLIPPKAPVDNLIIAVLVLIRQQEERLTRW